MATENVTTENVTTENEETNVRVEATYDIAYP